MVGACQCIAVKSGLRVSVSSRGVPLPSALNTASCGGIYDEECSTASWRSSGESTKLSMPWYCVTRCNSPPLEATR